MEMLSRGSPAAALCLLVGSLFALVVGFYRLQGNGATFFSTGWTWVILIILVSLQVFAGYSLVCHSRHARRTGSKECRFVLWTAAVALVLFFLIGEVLLRVVAEETPEGPLLGNVTLLPRDWTSVVSYRRSLWERTSREYGVFVPDEALGWTVGRNRQGVGPYGETYLSNEDGLRTGQNGPTIKNDPAGLRIAILGDSYTFGEDVSYGDTWGHQLEMLMGPGTQVLNFGVPGYGIDQAYLRYLRDVRDWHPHVVILSFISHDLVRSGMTYYWIGFPGAAVPGAKPRFSYVDNQLTVLNYPLPAPERIYSTPAIEDLPYVRSDSAYRPTDWDRHLYQYSYLLRFAISWNPPQLSSSYELDQDVQRIDERILQAFVRDAAAAKSRPLVVFLPEYREFRNASGPLSKRDRLGTRVAQAAGVEFLDLTACLETVDNHDRFTSGWHYTRAANAAVAHCLHRGLTRSNAVMRQQEPRASR